MNIIDRLFSFGSTFRLLLFIVGTILLVVDFITRHERKTVTLMFVFIGFYAIRREYKQWRINRLPEMEQIASRISAR